jgi:signal transduction histidine kinase/ActR/RegA family two-component response regulator
MGSLEGELLRVVERQSRRIPAPVFLACVMIAVFALGHAPLGAILTWLTLATAMLLYRRKRLSELLYEDAESEAARLRRAVRLSLVNGIVHGSSLGFFVTLPELERSLHTLVLLGLGAGSIATTAGYGPMFLAYLLPVVGGLSASWALIPGTGASWLEASMSLLVLMFGYVLFGLARDSWSVFHESFQIRLQQSALNAQLLDALDKAEAASRAKTRFLASASHDLRQPLHTLSLFGAALDMRPLDERSKDIARSMNEALQDLASELDSLLDVSKLDAGVVRASWSTLDLAQLLRRVTEHYHDVAARSGLALRVQCSGDLLIQSDRMLLERVLRNVIDNALKYTEKGFVTVAAFSCEPARIRLIVEDTGPGIPPSEHQRVFEEFYQVGNRERDRRKGLGLGLSIVRRLVDLLGIEMSFESTPGQGTRFQLDFAAVQEADGAVRTEAGPEMLIGGLSVLVIDDEPAIRLGMKTLLEGLGCRVMLAASTEGALEGAARSRPDLVLADLRLRGEDSGIQAIEALRRVHPGIRALLVSGDTAPERLRDAALAGIRMLHKPVPIDVLRQAIANAMVGKTASGETHSKAGETASGKSDKERFFSGT